MACPFFFPTQRASSIQWNFPARLPLGAGFCGTCRANGDDVRPSDSELRDFCNLGYADQCSRMPANRRIDCVRFAIAQDQGVRIQLHFVLERGHSPIQWGVLEYDAAAQMWQSAINEPTLQQQAECYIASYLQRTAGQRQLAGPARVAEERMVP